MALVASSRFISKSTIFMIDCRTAEIILEPPGDPVEKKIHYFCNYSWRH